MIERLRDIVRPDSRIVELGTGPGFFAERLMQKLPEITYQGLDYSEPMLRRAAERLSDRLLRATLTCVDLLSPDWTAKLIHPIGAFVSTWTLHDLGGENETSKVYRQCLENLPVGGLLINGDFVKPDGTDCEFEPGRFPIDRHLEILNACGFHEARCTLFLEHEIEDPTTSQNYACLEAMA